MFGGEVSAQWKTQKSVSNDFDSVEQSFAFSKSVKSNKQMKFPYSETEATLSVGCDSNDNWVYLHFTNEPNLLNNSIGDGINFIQTRMKWDSNIESVSLTQTWGSSFLHFSNDNELIAKIRNHNDAMLELDWYGEGKVYFSFSLNGSNSAVNQILNDCKNY